MTMGVLAILDRRSAAILLIWFFFGRERSTGYDREYEQEPPSTRPRRSCRRS